MAKTVKNNIARCIRTVVKIWGSVERLDSTAPLVLLCACTRSLSRVCIRTLMQLQANGLFHFWIMCIKSLTIPWSITDTSHSNLTVAYIERWLRFDLRKKYKRRSSRLNYCSSLTLFKFPMLTLLIRRIKVSNCSDSYRIYNQLKKEISLLVYELTNKNWLILSHYNTANPPSQWTNLLDYYRTRSRKRNRKIKGNQSR